VVPSGRRQRGTPGGRGVLCMGRGVPLRGTTTARSRRSSAVPGVGRIRGEGGSSTSSTRRPEIGPDGTDGAGGRPDAGTRNGGGREVRTPSRGRQVALVDARRTTRRDCRRAACRPTRTRQCPRSRRDRRERHLGVVAGRGDRSRAQTGRVDRVTRGESPTRTARTLVAS
jgi:hypothetical protein